MPKDVDSERSISVPKEVILGSEEKQWNQHKLMMNKGGVVVEETVDFGQLVIGEMKSKCVLVENTTNITKTLVSSKCLSQENQFSVSCGDMVELAPLTSVTVRVDCSVSQIGRTRVLCVFNFDEFSICLLYTSDAADE